MSFTLRVLIGLIGGLALGLGVSGTGQPLLRALPTWIEPIGIIFVNAIRMTIVPLVVSALVAGAASMQTVSAIGRLGARSLAVFVIALAAAGVFGGAVAFPLLGRLAIDPVVAASLRAASADAGRVALQSAGHGPSAGEWLIGLVPVNVFRAAADGSMLPLIVVALAFGIALTAIDGGRRDAVVHVLQGVADAMLVLVTWILRFTPVGVFALALPLGARMGLSAAGSLLYYVVLLSAVTVAYVVVVLAPAVVLVGRVPLPRFVKAAAPAMAVAFSSRSSLAALPATIEGAHALGLPGEIGTVFLPLAASMFRVGGAMAQVIGALFVARLYGVDLAPSHLATIIAVSVVTSLTIPGIPAGAIIVMAPVLAAVNVPVEAIGLLIGVDTIPDMFRTTANVVGWLAAGTLVAPGMPSRPRR